MLGQTLQRFSDKSDLQIRDVPLRNEYGWSWVISNPTVKWNWLLLGFQVFIYWFVCLYSGKQKQWFYMLQHWKTPSENKEAVRGICPLISAVNLSPDYVHVKAF